MENHDSRSPNLAAIFDLNGTLVDSEQAHWRAYKEALEPFGIDLSLEDFTLIFTRRGEGLKEILEAEARPDLLTQVSEISSAKAAVFAGLAPTIRLMPGVLDAVEGLRGNVRLAVESTSSSRDIDAMLASGGLGDYFELVIAGDTPWDEVQLGPKTKASRLKLIATTLGFAPSRVVVIGDSEKDVRAAKQNGMAAIAIPNAYTSDQDFSQADLVLASAAKLDLSVLRGVVGEREEA